jgi:hypothetical protein
VRLAWACWVRELESGPLAPAWAAGSAQSESESASVASAAGWGGVRHARGQRASAVECSGVQWSAGSSRFGRRGTSDEVGNGRSAVSRCDGCRRMGFGDVPGPARWSARSQQGERCSKGVRVGFGWSRGLFCGVDRTWTRPGMHVSEAQGGKAGGKVARRISTWAAELVQLGNEAGRLGKGVRPVRATASAVLVRVSCRRLEVGDWLESGGGSCASQCTWRFWRVVGRG